MNQPALTVPAFLMLILGIASCGQVVAVRHDLLPPATSLGILEAKDPHRVSVFELGHRPNHGCVRLAKLSAKGDPYTKRDLLEESLKREGAKIGADFIIVTGYREIEDNSTPHFVEYGAGIPLADDIQNPYLYGLACRKSSGRLGIDLSRNWSVTAVMPHSLAEKSGIQPGDRLVSVNGKQLRDDGYAYDQDVLARPPGDRVVIEYLTPDGNRISKDLTLESVP